MKEAFEEILARASEAVDRVKKAQEAETFTDTRVELRYAVGELQEAMALCEGLIKAIS